MNRMFGRDDAGSADARKERRETVDRAFIRIEVPQYSLPPVM